MKSVCALMIAAACLGGCKKGGGSGDGAQATEVLKAFTKPGADHAALTSALRPKADDYAAVFVGDAAQKMKSAMDPLWEGGKLTLKPSPEQTEVVSVAAPQSELVKGEGNAVHCPGGYKGIADKIQPKTVVHCARFVKPGEKLGLAIDGLVWVNGHWALFPKPFRALK